MGKYTSKRGLQRKGLMVICAVLAVVLTLLIGMLVHLIAGETPGDQGHGTSTGPVSGEVSRLKELLVQSVTEQEDAMHVVTTYGTVKYSYAFSDIICVEAETFEDYAVLEFGAMIDGKVVKLYTLIFNGLEGIPVGTLQVDGETFAVTAQFNDGSGVSGDSMVTFYAAQETFNDVVNSLSENEGFTTAD